MSISKSKEQFNSLFQQKYNKVVQLELEFNEEVKEPKLSKFDQSLSQALNYNPKDKEPLRRLFITYSSSKSLSFSSASFIMQPRLS